MKKLKTWQIVLLVIFYPVGICVWIYRAIKRSQLKKAREAEQAALSARREAERAEREKSEAVRAQISRHRSERREWLDTNCDYVSFTTHVIGEYLYRVPRVTAYLPARVRGEILHNVDIAIRGRRGYLFAVYLDSRFRGALSLVDAELDSVGMVFYGVGRRVSLRGGIRVPCCTHALP